MSDQDPEDLFEGRAEEAPHLKASEKLTSLLITSYEQAIRNGLTPCRALSVMLEWIAEECARLRADDAPHERAHI